MKESLSRRKVLVIAASALSVVAAAAHWLFGEPAPGGGASTQPPTETATDAPDTETPVPSKFKDITEYGAKPNPDDPDLASAVKNTKALRAAASDAGKGGTVYVPEGTFYLGQEERTSNFGFGESEPAGISIVGSGGGESTLALTRHLNNGNESHVLFKYRDVNHGEIEIRDLTVDGNAKNLGNLIKAKRASRAFEMEGRGSITFQNVLFRNIYTTALRLRDFTASIDRCTFEEIGIGSKNHGGSGHAVETHCNDELRITRSSFRRIGSFAVNWRFNDGTVVVEDCRVRGTGTGIVKLSAGKRLEIRNSYLEPHTKWLTEHIETPSAASGDAAPFHGRHFINRLFERAKQTPTVVIENVVFRDCTHEAFKIRKAPIELKGDMIALHNASGRFNEEEGNAVFRDYAWTGSAIRNVDIKRMSVHDSAGYVFETENSGGKIETLSRAGNKGLGTTGKITIGTDNQGGDPYKPTVVSQKDVGCLFAD